MSTAFESLALSPSLLAVVEELGYQDPTPVQVAAIPVLLEGRDLIGQSRTGSGKTVAFGLPILQRLKPGGRVPQALVVCPTRELCTQVARELRQLGRKYKGLHVLVVSGGASIGPQIGALERGADVVVGTPGRLLDHLKRRTIDLRGVAMLVLDEADRMLDMGFQADVEAIIAATPASRQTAFFSATFPASIEAMSREHQRDAERVVIEDAVEDGVATRQLVVPVDPDQRLETLYGVLGEHAFDSALIFCNFKASVADVDSSLAAAGGSVDCLHGGLDQFHRDQVLAKFRNESVRILVATDVAARGLDVEKLDLVVNYELPATPEVYVHRIGRTGRAGNVGLAVSLATKRDEKRIAAIEAFTGNSLERRPAPLAASNLSEKARQSKMATILVSGGRKDKVRPGDILGALTGEAGGLHAGDVGKIEIHDRLSYVAVSRRLCRRAAKSLDAGRIKGRRFRATLV